MRLFSALQRSASRLIERGHCSITPARSMQRDGEPTVVDRELRSSAAPGCGEERAAADQLHLPDGSTEAPADSRRSSNRGRCVQQLRGRQRAKLTAPRLVRLRSQRQCC